MFAGFEGIVALGIFTFVSGVASAALEDKGRKKDAQTVNLMTRIIFWALLIPQLYMLIVKSMSGFGMFIDIF